MRIVDIMSEDLVIADLRGTTRELVLEEVVACISAHAKGVDASRAFRVLIERERVASTGVGGGFAIPHARLPSISEPIACLARSRAGIDFGAVDKNPTHLILALLAPDKAPGFHLKALARASRLFRDETFRAQLLTAENAGALWSALQAQDESLSAQV